MQRTPASRKGSAENRGNSCQRNWARAAPPTVAARTRIVSAAGIRLDHRKSARPFKGIFCDDISEFESYIASHAVRSRSLWLIYGTSKNSRHSTRLARLKRARPRAGAWRWPERSAPFRDSPFAKKRFVDHIVCDTTIG